MGRALAARRADARETRGCDPAGGPPPLRAEMGWLPRDRLPDEGRCVHPEPRPAAARSLLPRTPRRADRAPAPRLRRRRRDRHRHKERPRLRRAAASAHPAASRVAQLAKETPSSVVAFDLLAVRGRSIVEMPQSARREQLETLLAGTTRPLHLTPMTRDRARAAEWLERFEGAGLDGVIAKPEDLPYMPGKRAMFKIKHARTADCVVAGFRWYKDTDDAVGSLLLGLYDDSGVLHHVGVTSSFTMEKRKALARELEPLRKNALASHPWRQWADAEVTG